MARKNKENPHERATRQMSDTSWFILRALHPTEARSGYELIQRIEAALRAANYAYTKIEPATVHYALKRMETDGLIRNEGRRMMDVPGPYGSTRREERTVYVITGQGLQALSLRDQLEARLRLASFGTAVPGGATL